MEEVLKRLDRVERLLRAILKERSADTDTWVKARAIMKITNWDKEGMRRARNNNLVKFKRTKEGVLYSIQSLNPSFFEQPVNTNA